jgi:YidC/Oxa1 family membrane protein insertase
MNKKDLIPVIVLALMIPLWIFIDRTFIAPKFPAPAPAPAPAQTEMQEEAAGEPTQPVLAAAKEQVEQAPAPEEPVAEEKTVSLANDRINLELTSIGGGIKSATLLNYPEFNEEGSDPVFIDFSNSTALAYQGLVGIGPADAQNIALSDDGRSVVFTKGWNSGVSFERTIAIGDNYLLTVSDRFVNAGSNPWNLPATRILTGYMENPEDTKAMKGMSILGVDSYSPDGHMNYWGRKLNKLYKKADKPASLDAVPEDMHGVVVDWVSAKNKFFTQILRPTETVATMAVLSNRDTSEKAVLPVDVAAALVFQPTVVSPGTSIERNFAYYIGPKNYSILKDAGYNMEGVMEFETIGFFSFMNWMMEPARKFLLWTMNMFYGVIPNYGVAIILLTLLVRILFWPLTHKSTESMKRMQELQPQIKEIQAKYKNKKDQASMQKMQAETMALYRENKVNPMGGCLPLLVQMPVFFALFTVLRNAIELRYSSFLWIADLSHPENLFAGQIPFVGSLNILPLLMSASMVWQQKISTPATAATPEQQQQQKMMMIMMPIMMLFFFYSMPSGLVLYWTTSNLLMIAQTGIRNLRKKVKKA